MSKAYNDMIPPVVLAEMREMYDKIDIFNLSVDALVDKDHAISTILHIEVIRKLCGQLKVKRYNPYHDYDKLAYYIVTDSVTAHNLHRASMKHHNRKVLDKDVIVEVILDWESAQYTKVGKPYTAYEFLMKKYHDSPAFPLFKEAMLELNLWGMTHSVELTEVDYNRMHKSISDEKLIWYLQAGYDYLGTILSELESK